VVLSVLYGFNATIFAYGPTGAGKTFTMYGAPDAPGVIPRAAACLFAGAAAHDMKVVLKASMVELYRNEFRNLLEQPMEELEVFRDPQRGTLVRGLSEHLITSEEEFLELLERGTARRATGATAINEHSSRSHLLVMLYVDVTHKSGDTVSSKLLLVDLAGSERLNRSQVAGDAAKEAIEVNKSLTALGDVIEALTAKRSQVPYRNHKLTQLLSDSIGGTAKTLMFVNVAPGAYPADVEEATTALKFAVRANSITPARLEQLQSQAARQFLSLIAKRKAVTN
jgi:kinesin family protein C2/C3